MDNNDSLFPLLKSISDVYAAEIDPKGAYTARTLLTTPAPDRFNPVPPSLLDEGIRRALLSSDHPVACAALAVHSLLPWGSNPVESTTEQSIAALISVATLLGPEGPIPAPDVRLGLVYMQPESYYPLHLHDADETYVIIAGQALWTAGDDIRMRGAGDTIHHPSLLPHAFRTGSEGFVALWRWSGDINTHSYAFTEDPDATVHSSASVA